MTAKRLTTGLCLTICACAVWCAVANAAQPANDSFTIIAKRAFTAAADQPGYIDNAVIIVRNGKIEAVGSGLTPPQDLPVIRLRDETVIPGLIDAANRMARQCFGDRTSQAGCQAIDTYDQYADYSRVLADGVTTVHLNPGPHRLITGTGAVVKLGGPMDQRVLRKQADLTINLGERMFDPPVDVTFSFPASSDVPIPPAVPQRPHSRLGQLLDLNERISEVQKGLDPQAPFIYDDWALQQAWNEKLPLRIQLQRAVDIEQAIEFARQYNRPVYLVGLEEADLSASELSQSGLPMVLQANALFIRSFQDIGPDPDAFAPPVSAAAALKDAKFALAGSFHDAPFNLRLAATTAVRAGIDPDRALTAITRTPAEILGISNRVGSIEPGKDADLVILSGDPLDAAVNVLQVYTGGELAFQAPETDALIVKAGTIWTGSGSAIRDGAVLIEDGKITAVGPTVPRPMFARVVDAGPDAFVTPGFIDSHGHLGLEHDKSGVDSGLQIADVVGYAGPQFLRVAKAGITTVLLSPYNVSSRGGRMAAIKTAGDSRDTLITRAVAAMKFTLRGGDPILAINGLKGALNAGKKYAEKWDKYEKELAEWEKAHEEGKTPTTQKAETTEEVEEKKADPITGTWKLTLSGDPLPETVEADLTLRLDGNKIEGRMKTPDDPEEAVVTGTLSGKHISATIDVETPFGPPSIEADLDREDHMVGSVKIAEFSIHLEATRTDKSEVEFKVTRKKKTGKDGKPLPPTVDEQLEPLRKLIKKQIPAVVDVDNEANIKALIKLFVEEFKLPLVMLNADSAEPIVDDVAKAKVPVIVSTQVVHRSNRRFYCPAAELPREGIPIALQSDAEDGARGLGYQGLYCVANGADPETILRALTVDAAKMLMIDDRVGSLQPGRDGDLVIFSGHPFEAETQTLRVFVNGKEVQ